MAEDQSWFYTNTFEVKDLKGFRSFCKTYELEIFNEGPQVGCFHLELGLPQIVAEFGNELSFLRELGRYLQDGSVAIVVDARVTEREYCPTSWQITYAVNNKGKMKFINPVDIFSLATDLGTQIAPLQDMCPPQQCQYPNAIDQPPATNVQGPDEKLAAKFLACNGERLSYSQTFAVYDEDGEEQTHAEVLIAAHLFDEYEKFDLFGHVRWIIACVVESFFQEVLYRAVEEMLQLMEILPTYLATWQHQLAKPNEKPSEEEAAIAGRDTLLLTLRFLSPEWVKIDSDS